MRASLGLGEEFATPSTATFNERLDAICCWQEEAAMAADQPTDDALAEEHKQGGEAGVGVKVEEEAQDQEHPGDSHRESTGPDCRAWCAGCGFLLSCSLRLHHTDPEHSCHNCSGGLLGEGWSAVETVSPQGSWSYWTYYNKVSALSPKHCCDSSSRPPFPAQTSCACDRILCRRLGEGNRSRAIDRAWRSPGPWACCRRRMVLTAPQVCWAPVEQNNSCLYGMHQH